MFLKAKKQNKSFVEEVKTQKENQFCLIDTSKKSTQLVNVYFFQMYIIEYLLTSIVLRVLINSLVFYFPIFVTRFFILM